MMAKVRERIVQWEISASDEKIDLKKARVEIAPCQLHEAKRY